MKILFVNRLMGIFWGGGESFDYNMALTIKKLGHKVTILTGKPLFSASKNKIDELEVCYLATPYLRWISDRLANKIPKIPIAFMLLDLYFFEKSAFNWIKKHKNEFDIIQILALPRLANKIVKELKKPAVVRYPGPPSKKWDLPIIRELSDNPLIEFFAAGDTINFTKSKGVFLNNIPQGVDYISFKKDKSTIRTKHNIKDDDLLLVSVGRIISGKGFEFLIDGFKEALKQIPNMKLMIVGVGALLSQLRKKTELLGIKDKVIFTGKIEHRNLPQYYSASDIFLLLSYYENFSNSVLEAMSCELPVIATNVGGFPLQIKDGINGFLVNYGDVNLLSEKIIFLANNPGIRKKMGAINRQEIINNYKWGNSAQKLLSLYNKVLSNKKTKVMFVIPNLGKGGAERVVINLLENLDREKIQPECVFYDSNHVYKIPHGIKFFNLNLPGTDILFLKIVRSIIRMFKIKRIIEKENPDIVFSFLNKVNLAVILAKSLTRNSAKLIISEHNTPSSQLSHNLVKFLMKVLYPKAEKIIAVSNGVKKDLITKFGLSAEKIQVIYNPVNINQIQQLSKEKVTEHSWFNEDIPIIINVASLTKQKGQEYLLKAFKIVRDKINCRLVILGEGEKEKELKNLTEKLGIQTDVAFLGFQKNPFKFITKSAVFVLSSLWEGFPNVILEVMSCGVPVISTDCPSGPNEIIEDGENGLLVPVGDEKKMAKAISTVLDNQEVAMRFSSNAMRYIKKFSVEKMVSQYSQIFNEVLL